MMRAGPLGSLKVQFNRAQRPLARRLVLAKLGLSHAGHLHQLLEKVLPWSSWMVKTYRNVVLETSKVGHSK